MEIREPVILEIPQGKRNVRVEITSRADGRDLIAAIARRMATLPDDGVHDMPAELVAEVAAAPVKQHAPHTRDGKLTPPELREQLAGMSAESLSYLWIHVNGYCPAAVNSALRHERESRPPAPEPASPEAVAVLANSIATGTPLLVDDEADEAELRRADAIREEWKPVLAGLGERVAALSVSEPEHRCECSHHMNDHDEDVPHECHFPGCGCARWRRAAPKAHAEPPRVVDGTVEPTSLEAHRSVRLLRQGDDLVVVDSTPCPEVHPSKETPCVGGEHHGPPCRDLDGDEWVPAGSTVTA